DGTRNRTFFQVARRLGQLVGGGELEEGVVLAALDAIAAGWPNSAHSRDTIRRALALGQETPHSAPRPGASPITITFHDELGSEPMPLCDEPLGSESMTNFHQESSTLG